MSTNQEKEPLEMKEIAEVSDEALDDVSGGYIYHDPGDARAHRKGRHYVLNDQGDIIMKVGDLKTAQHWAGNLKESSDELTAEQFNHLRTRGSL